MLNLPDVTLCAVSTANIALTQRAIELSRRQCSFGDTVFLTSADVSGDYRVEKIQPFGNLQGGADFVFGRLVEYINTSFVLMIQWDGYVISSDAWSNEFLDYDYIGAKWPWHKDGYTVGNSGFCLRSRKLLETLARDDVELPGARAEDDYICRTLRPRLEGYGITFAPERVADLFSYERAKPVQTTFGFHGPFNMWRHMDYSEVESVVGNMDEYVVKSRHYAELMNAYFQLGKFDLVNMMTRRVADVG